MCHLYGSNTYCRDHKSVIRTDYIHNTHCEKYLSLTQHNILSIFALDIYIILWYIRIIIEFCMIFSSEAQAVWPMCGEIRIRFVRYVITTIRACYALLRSRSALCLYGFCRMALQLLGTLERRRGALCPFAFLLTMEKLQLYSPRRLCYNSLVLGVSRCTGQEISACREASLGRSKLGRSKLGRNGENIGRSAPYRSEKNVEYLEEHLN